MVNLRKLRRFEKKHQVITFVIIMLLTILLTRVLTLVHDPNPIILGYELHHFYYGVILLIVTTLVMLFGNARQTTSLTLSAVATGWIADELFFVMGRIANEDYTSTIWGAVFSAAVVVVLVVIINLFFKKK